MTTPRRQRIRYFLFAVLPWAIVGTMTIAQQLELDRRGVWMNSQTRKQEQDSHIRALVKEMVRDRFTGTQRRALESRIERLEQLANSD